MPHIQLMISENLREAIDVPQVLRRLVESLSLCETVSPAAVKAYASIFEDWQMGHGSPTGFIHCQVSILDGRSDELQRTISAVMNDSLREACKGPLDAGLAAITLELREMRGATYHK